MSDATSFPSDDASHHHSLQTLEQLARYTDFMRSIDTMADVGCGTGKDLEWWATQTIIDDDDQAVPLDIKCTGIDTTATLKPATEYDNIQFEKRDFETAPYKKNQFDVLWCHNAFQYAINPMGTLKHFYDMLSDDGMLAIVIPQTTNIVFNMQEFNQLNGQYFNYTLVSLIHMLAVSGFDCKAGFFKKNLDDPWIHAVVYKSAHKPMDPRTTTWYDLLDKGLLPDSADDSINRCGYVKQRYLVLPWLDRSNRAYANQ